MLDQFGKFERQYDDGEDLLHGTVELESRDHLSAAQVDDSDPTDAFGMFLDEWDIAEDRALSDLGEADESVRTTKIQAAGEAGKLRHDLGAAGLEIREGESAASRFQQPRPTEVNAWRMGHSEAAYDWFTGIDIQNAAATGLVLAPSFGFVREAKAGDVAHTSIDDGEAIHVATIFRGEGRDERWAPSRHETLRAIEGAEAGETGIDRPD